MARLCSLKLLLVYSWGSNLTTSGGAGDGDLCSHYIGWMQVAATTTVTYTSGSWQVTILAELLGLRSSGRSYDTLEQRIATEVVRGIR